MNNWQSFYTYAVIKINTAHQSKHCQNGRIIVYYLKCFGRGPDSEKSKHGR